MRWLIRAVLTATVLAPLGAPAQQPAPQPAAPAPGSVMFTVLPDHRYMTTPFVEFLMGRNWRDAWATPVTVPVLDLGKFANGLTPFRAGGNQSRTLHFNGADGKTYIFRSTGKWVQRALPREVQNTPVGHLIQDLSSSMHPTGHGASARLQQALGLPASIPTLVVLPDDPRLGEWRQAYAGMLGQIELRADDKKETDERYGASKIHGSEKLLENLEQSFEYRLDSRQYLKARLLDFILGDTDRGADQWDWALYEKDGEKLYRPIPRDRDYAFMYAQGLVTGLVRPFFPKLSRFKPGFTEITDLVFMTQEFDRSHLVGLSRQEWDAVVGEVRSALTDEVLADAVTKLPPEHQQYSRDRILNGLRARRDGLAEVAREYYTMVSRQADIFGTNAVEHAEITRNADGTVLVALFDEQHKQVFSRTFTPGETVEIRVYLQGGADRAVVRGQAGDRTIKVRVAGGAGDDLLADSSRVASGGIATVFYDAHGHNSIVPGAHTRVDRRPYVTPQPKTEYDAVGEKQQEQEQLEVYEERRGRFQDLINNASGDVLEQKTSSTSAQHWGGKAGWGPAFDYREGAGLILGIARNIKQFGFRHDEYEERIRLNGWLALNGGIGLEASGDFRKENSSFGALVQLRASQFEANRFYGFGNNTPLIDRKLALVERDEIVLRPALNWRSRQLDLTVGPIARYTTARPQGGSPAQATAPIGVDGAYLQAGLLGQVQLSRVDHSAAPTRGFRLESELAAYPALLDVDNTYATAGADAALYVPLGWPTLALRLGGSRAWGDFALHDAAFLGGRHTLRGYRWNRFAGDTEAHGSAELRLPLATVTLLTRGQLGVIGLADAGRVWYNGESADGWHTSAGAGLSFRSMNRAVSVIYARGEESRMYVQLGMPF